MKKHFTIRRGPWHAGFTTDENDRIITASPRLQGNAIGFSLRHIQRWYTSTFGFKIYEEVPSH